MVDHSDYRKLPNITPNIRDYWGGCCSSLTGLSSIWQHKSTQQIAESCDGA